MDRGIEGNSVFA